MMTKVCKAIVVVILLSVCDVVASSWVVAAAETKTPTKAIHIRGLQEQADCGDILATWTSSQVGAIIEDGIDQSMGDAGADLKSLALPLVKYGVEIRKVCAVCSDFPEFGDCGYGGDVAHSGLLMIPLKEDDSATTAEGTHKAIIYNHGTRAVAQPTTDFVYQDNFFEIILSALFTATTRSVSIMSDYMSQGESFGSVYRGYIVRKSYETSVVPLYLQARKIVEDENECSAVSDSVFIFGYSEGGYSSVSVAEKLHSMGMDIIRVDPGGAPFWVSSATFVDIVDFVIKGTFPEDVRFYLQYLGFSFSSSRSDMPNFEAGQDMLTAEARQTMLDFLASDIPIEETLGIEAANNMVPTDDMLSIYNPDFISFIETSLAENDRDPCKNRPIAGINDLLCQALQEQDIHLVLQNAEYPVVVCFSPGDEIVSIRNVPDLSGNPNVTFYEVSGTHSQGGNMCFVASTQYILSSDFMDYLVTEKTSECGSGSTGTAGSESEGSDTSPPSVNGDGDPGSDTSPPSVNGDGDPGSDASRGFSINRALATILVVNLFAVVYSTAPM